MKRNLLLAFSLLFNGVLGYIGVLYCGVAFLCAIGRPDSFDEFSKDAALYIPAGVSALLVYLAILLWGNRRLRKGISWKWRWHLLYAGLSFLAGMGLYFLTA